ncbi:MAG: aldo/keto reductase [Caldilinea sp.]|nr:aldo/keto reductase [Caldilineaceae bacterium]MCO5209049.1 aldo/keto reductase [Caldilinea sp.]MCW5841606.1 aldo/keto reductase [Caldilinea sp.]
MQYRYLGRTGMKVSELCLGAMTFGRESTEADSIQMMNRFVAAGGNFIDTANVYTRGVSEEIVGRWLRNRKRDDLVIATKARFPMGDGPNDLGLSRKHLLSAVEDSLRRLQTDYIDLYQVHCWDPGTPLDETLTTLDTLVRSGKVRYIGASNYSGWQLQKAVDTSRHQGWEPFSCLQPLYNLLDRSLEWELVQVCQIEGLGIIPWSPLRGGWLSGKYRRGMEAPVAGTRIEKAEQEGWSESWSAYNTERTWNVLDALFAVAEEAGKEPVQVALRWLLQRPGVTAPIIGARTLAHLESNLGAAGWELTAEQMARLTTVSEPDLPYPYDFITRAAGARR